MTPTSTTLPDPRALAPLLAFLGSAIALAMACRLVDLSLLWTFADARIASQLSVNAGAVMVVGALLLALPLTRPAPGTDPRPGLRRGKAIEALALLALLGSLHLEGPAARALGITALLLLGLGLALVVPRVRALLADALPAEGLVAANAWATLALFGGALLGMAALDAGWLRGPLARDAALLALAIGGVLASLPARLAARCTDARPTPAQERGLKHAVLGLAWFWFVVVAIAAELPAQARALDQLDGDLAHRALAAFALGVCAGAMACVFASGRRIELGLVPLGALLLSAAGLDLFFALRAFDPATGAGLWRAALDAWLLGMGAGLWVVPLQAFVQGRATPEALPGWLARALLASALAAAAALGLAAGLAWLRLGAAELLLVTALLNVVVAVYTFSLLPEFLLRLLSWLVANVLYRVRVTGMHQLPAEGPVLVVCNHVSFMDALLLLGSIPRPTRFIMYYRIFNLPIARWLFQGAKAIPIAGTKEDPVLMQRAFERADAELADGQVLGIFPEGALTRDGEIAPFRPGVERILAARPVPVLPMALCGMWASMWSRRRGLRLPRRFRAEVQLVVGPLLPPEEATAARLEAIVRGLRGDRP